MLVQPQRSAPAGRRLEFGIYRDGDNNLDQIQADVLRQARAVSSADAHIEFSIQDTTKRREPFAGPGPRTESYALAEGVVSDLRIAPVHDMSARANLAAFVARTLDRAQAAGAHRTWIELVDHGAGDGGGLEADSFQRGIMRADDIAGAIADGVAQHAGAHPEDAGRRVEGVVANQCLMGTLGFADALSKAGVNYLAASPETMLAPGVPTSVALAVDRASDPEQLARGIVDTVMDTRYLSAAGGYAPAAAFDVFDLDPDKIATMESAVTALDAALAGAVHERPLRAAVTEDARAIAGMARFSGQTMPWHADRPALRLYQTFAEDGRLPEQIRQAARSAADAVGATVLAHRESGEFAPFDGASYADAAGPTVHFPTRARELDPWAPQVSETDNAFYQAAGGPRLARALCELGLRA